MCCDLMFGVDVEVYSIPVFSALYLGTLPLPMNHSLLFIKYYLGQW